MYKIEGTSRSRRMSSKCSRARTRIIYEQRGRLGSKYVSCTVASRLCTHRSFTCLAENKLKSQLTALADLVTPLDADEDEDAEGLEDEDMDALREAGIRPSASAWKRRKQSKAKATHITFAESEEEGPLLFTTTDHERC